MYLAKEQLVSVKGRNRRVRVARTDRSDFFMVEVDDKKYGAELTSKFDKSDRLFTIKVDGKQYRIKMDQTESELITIQVDGRSFEVKQEIARKKTLEDGQPQIPMEKESMIKLTLEEGAIIASMPGKVVAVKVKKDDKVNAGDVLCILEAMKMENEILASKTGVVKEVNVSEGTSVNKGQVLIVLKSL